MHLPARRPINRSSKRNCSPGLSSKTNEGYAIAKIAALEMAKMYRRQYGTAVVSLMPTNLYGPNDNFDLESAHVLPALIRRFHEAKLAGDDKVTIWGTGTRAASSSMSTTWRRRRSARWCATTTTSTSMSGSAKTSRSASSQR